MQQKILQAAWAIPVTSPPIKDASILIAGNRIKAIGQKSEIAHMADSNCVIHDYGQAIIVPGFINLHTHLEYTNLHYLSPEGGLFSWLPRLMAVTATWSDTDRLDSVARGIQEIAAAGTTLVIDNSYSGASVKALAKSGLRAIVGLELFGVDASLSDKQWQRWQQRLQNLWQEEGVKEAHREGRLDLTVAPHAPYTVCPTLWYKAQHWAKTNKQMVLTHLAESEAECRWFARQNKDLTQFLIDAFSRLDPDFARTHEQKLAWKEGSKTPVQHLYKYGLLDDNLLAGHAVHINDQDLKLLKKQAASIAHCPRSNARLECGQAPLGKMIKSGIKMGLGTDSKASNDDLDMLAEAQFALLWRKEYEPDLAMGPKDFIEHLTIKAALCIGRERELGSLTPGKWADLAIFTLPQTKMERQFSQDPYYILLQGKLKLQALFVGAAEVDSFQAAKMAPV